MSTNSTNGGFSLNGTRRSQGYIGQTSLSRSFPRTPMKGITPKGYGGCCGKYLVKPIIQSAVTSLNDPTKVKKSVLNNNGMILTTYRWIRRPQPFSSTKPDNNANCNSQSDYIPVLRNKEKWNISNKWILYNGKYVINPCYSQVNPNPPVCSKSCNGTMGRINGIPNKYLLKTITEPANRHAADSQSAYISDLVAQCTQNNKKTLSIGRAPIACGIIGV